MSSSQLRERIAALRADAREVGELLAQQAPGMTSEDLFEVAGELQGVLNSGEGAQLVAAAHAASHETRLTERGAHYVSVSGWEKIDQAEIGRGEPHGRPRVKFVKVEEMLEHSGPPGSASSTDE